jgi:hypothetical protein
VNPAGQRRQSRRYDRPTEIKVLDGGLIVLVGFRSVVASCLDCHSRFDTTDGAIAHVADSRHRVECDDRIAYTYAPGEVLDGVR